MDKQNNIINSTNTNGNNELTNNGAITSIHNNSSITQVNSKKQQLK